MTIADDVIAAAFHSDEEFREALGKAIREGLGLSINEFSARSNISWGTIYTLLGGRRNPNMSTLRDIVNAIRFIEGYERGEFVVVITDLPTLDTISTRKVIVDGKTITIQTRSVTTMEDAIVAAVQAERSGALAVICPMMTDYTLSHILSIPVVPLSKTSLAATIEAVLKK